MVEPCKSRLAFEFLPKKKQSLDLKQIGVSLKKNGVLIDVETTFLIMARVGGSGVSLFKSGKIIVKDTNIEKEARKIAELLIKKME